MAATQRHRRSPLLLVAPSTAPRRNRNRRPWHQQFSTLVRLSSVPRAAIVLTGPRSCIVVAKMAAVRAREEKPDEITRPPNSKSAFLSVCWLSFTPARTSSPHPASFAPLTRRSSFSFAHHDLLFTNRSTWRRRRVPVGSATRQPTISDYARHCLCSGSRFDIRPGQTRDLVSFNSCRISSTGFSSYALQHAVALSRFSLYRRSTFAPVEINSHCILPSVIHPSLVTSPSPSLLREAARSRPIVRMPTRFQPQFESAKRTSFEASCADLGIAAAIRSFVDSNRSSGEARSNPCAPSCCLVASGYPQERAKRQESHRKQAICPHGVLSRSGGLKAEAGQIGRQCELLGGWIEEEED